MSPSEQKQFPRWIIATTATTVATVVIAGGGLFAYNQFVIAQASAAKSAAVSTATTAPPIVISESGVDDSGAVSALVMAVGALFIYIERSSAEDCSYLSLTASTLSESTPLDSYRGTYESITSGVQNISMLCSNNPADNDAISYAQIVRPKVTKILDDRVALGNSNWSSFEQPIAGKQAQ